MGPTDGGVCICDTLLCVCVLVLCTLSPFPVVGIFPLPLSRPLSDRSRNRPLSPLITLPLRLGHPRRGRPLRRKKSYLFSLPLITPPLPLGHPRRGRPLRRVPTDRFPSGVPFRRRSSGGSWQLRQSVSVSNDPHLTTGGIINTNLDPLYLVFSLSPCTLILLVSLYFVSWLPRL